MYQNEREREIINILKNETYVTVKQLSQLLYTSESSIRRDLASLEKQNKVKRSYGGVELNPNLSSIIPFSVRVHQNIAAKKMIAKKAAQFIHEGAIIFLDQSSSAYFLAQEILKMTNLTVVTNNIEILSLLTQSNIEVISSGGRLSNSNRACLVGSDAQKIFTEIQADYLFFSTNALSKSGIVSDCDREEICIRNTMMANASKKIFLCDSEKYGIYSGFRQCTIQDIDFVISEINCKEYFSELGEYQKLVL